MKIALAQLNYTIGDFEANTLAMIRAISQAREEKSDLIIFSELAVCGYPPLDLLEYRSFISACDQSVKKIASACKGIAAIVGAPSINPGVSGKNLFNTAYFMAEGKVEQTVHKTLLPTYDIFDEYRYFEQNRDFGVVEYQGKRIAITICEDLWYNQPILTGFGKNRLYPVCPMDELKKQQPDFVVNIAASPFSYMHDGIKTGILVDNARNYGLPVFYVNQTGAQTELIFDGGSMMINDQGRVVCRMKQFEEDLSFITLEDLSSTTGNNEKEIPGDRQISMIYEALVLGIRDYFRKMGFGSAILGLSGGIDSAVSLVLASRALGPENMKVLLLPSQYSSEHSVKDAVTLAKNLGVSYHILQIHDIFDTFLTTLKPVFKNMPHNIAEENIQARIRGNMLMAYSNKFGNILLNTSNKSEAAVGYGTLYGDMSGGLSILGDVYKTDVYRLAEFINRNGEVIPVNTITKPPSAELRPDQKDSDSLPDYELLDKILFNYIEMKKSEPEIIALGIQREMVAKTIRMVNQNEYKRYQTPPILRVSSKAFGSGRRMPLVAKYK